MTRAKDKIQKIILNELGFIGKDKFRAYMQDIERTVTRFKMELMADDLGLISALGELTPEVWADLHMETILAFEQLDITEIIALGIDYGVYPEGDPVEREIRSQSWDYLVAKGSTYREAYDTVFALTDEELSQAASFFEI